MSIFRASLTALSFAAGLIAAARADVGPVTTASASHIILPTDDDDYSKLVARTAAGDQSVDFRALRFAYLKSAARKRSGSLLPGSDLHADIAKAVAAGDDAGVRVAAEKVLSVNYTDMLGQKFLRASCTRLHDDACAAQAHFVESGLLNSIIHTGDGKTCATGWEVASVPEEYFVLSTLGARPQMQSLISGPPSCDALETVDQTGKAETYFFRIEAVLEDERSMFDSKR